jgi:serine/threonine protein kinase
MHSNHPPNQLQLEPQRRLGQAQASHTWLAKDVTQIPAKLCVVKQLSSTLISPWHQAYVKAAKFSELGKFEAGFQPALPRYLGYLESAESLSPDQMSGQKTGQKPEQMQVVMEYVPGVSLGSFIDQAGQYTTTEIWQFLATLLPTLVWLHHWQIIHGDIKPENLIQVAQWRGATESIVLVDIGTISPQSVSSPIYAAPEQLQGNTNFASDLYSLGMTCLHLWTGIHPFHLRDIRVQDWLQAPQAQNQREASQLADFLEQFIQPQPRLRLTADVAARTAIRQVRGKQRLVSRLSVTSPVNSGKDTGMIPAQTWVHESLTKKSTSICAVALNVVDTVAEQRCASASEDKTIRIWDLATGQLQAILPGHTKAVQAIAFHPQHADCLVSAGADGKIHYWDLQSELQQPQIRHTCSAHNQAINALAYGVNGQLLASASKDKTIKLWYQQELDTTLVGHTLAVNALAFQPTAPDHQPLLVSCSDDTTVRVWDIRTGMLLKVLQHHTWAVRTLAFSPDGQFLATAGTDRTIQIWDTQQWQLRRTLAGHSWPVSGLAWLPGQDVLFSSSWDQTIKVWQVSTGQEQAVWPGHQAAIHCLAVSSSGQWLASGSQDGVVNLWPLAESFLTKL